MTLFSKVDISGTTFTSLSVCSIADPTVGIEGSWDIPQKLRTSFANIPYYTSLGSFHHGGRQSACRGGRLALWGKWDKWKKILSISVFFFTKLAERATWACMNRRIQFEAQHLFS